MIQFCFIANCHTFAPESTLKKTTPSKRRIITLFSHLALWPSPPPLAEQTIDFFHHRLAPINPICSLQRQP